MKPPFCGVEKPWHQDNAYFSVAPLESILSVWTTLDDAEVENGCVHGSRAVTRMGAFQHHHGRDCEIDPSARGAQGRRWRCRGRGDVLLRDAPARNTSEPFGFAQAGVAVSPRGADTRILDEASTADGSSRTAQAQRPRAGRRRGTRVLASSLQAHDPGKDECHAESRAALRVRRGRGCRRSMLQNGADAGPDGVDRSHREVLRLRPTGQC